MTALSYIYSSQIAILEQQGKKNTRSAYVYMQDLLFQVDWNLLFFYYRFNHVWEGIKVKIHLII